MPLMSLAWDSLELCRRPRWSTPLPGRSPLLLLDQVIWSSLKLDRARSRLLISIKMAPSPKSTRWPAGRRACAGSRPVGAENLIRRADQGRCTRKNVGTCRATYVPHSVAPAVRQDPDGDLEILVSDPIGVFGTHRVRFRAIAVHAGTTPLPKKGRRHRCRDGRPCRGSGPVVSEPTQLTVSSTRIVASSRIPAVHARSGLTPCGWRPHIPRRCAWSSRD
jgi:hypothetical protein